MTIKTTFCGIEAVVGVTGLPARRILELVDCGDYLWVWNVSNAAGGRRELRFWSPEINDPAATGHLSLDEVLARVLPQKRPAIRQWELEGLLQMQTATLITLRDELEAREENGRVYIPRPALEKFFRARWCGQFSLRSGRQTNLALK